MSKANIIFILDNKEERIQCSQEDKMRDICIKYVTKINSNLNSLLFIYEGNQLNFDLKFKEQANSKDINNNEMKVFVYKKEDDGLICPKCGEKIIFNKEELYPLISSNNKIKENIIKIKAQLENIINSKPQPTINLINNHLKNIDILLNTINEDIINNN